MSPPDRHARTERFPVGRSVVLREILDGRVWTATPATVVADSEDLLALHTPAGARCRRPAHEDGTPLRLPRPDRAWNLLEEPWNVETLRLSMPGEAHSVQLHWSLRPRRLRRWYVNLEAPPRRTQLGFDLEDHIVDIEISPDRRAWQWKDLDELEEARALGLVADEEIAARIAEGERVLDRARRCAPPFRGSWPRWRPDPAWSVPALPYGWKTVVGEHATNPVYRQTTAL